VNAKKQKAILNGIKEGENMKNAAKAQSKEEILERYADAKFVESKITDINIVMTGSFHDSVSLLISYKGIAEDKQLLPLCNTTNNIGYIIQRLYYLYNMQDDESVELSSFIDWHITVVEFNDKPVAFGYDDNFIEITDFLTTV